MDTGIEQVFSYEALFFHMFTTLMILVLNTLLVAIIVFCSWKLGLSNCVIVFPISVVVSMEINGQVYFWCVPCLKEVFFNVLIYKNASKQFVIFLYSLFQIVFIPIWIVMCVAMIGVLYRIILTIILMKSPDLIPEQRRGNLSSAIGYSFLVIPLLIFEVKFLFHLI